MADVIETRLDNGLKLLLQPSHHAPVVSTWIWYKVGSRNERSGSTGISHWVEHMLFKGTQRMAKGDVFRLTARHGGHNNAFTSEDFTCYFETLPAPAWELALEIEADRMVNSRFDAEEVESERTVILAERQGSENNPRFQLSEEMGAAAFRVHPYRWSVIGNACDLQVITREELYGHYQTYYTPNNAVLVIAGDVGPEAALAGVRARFGSLEAAPPPPPVTAVEPPQFGERRVQVRRPGSAPYLQIAFHIPAVTHPDLYPLMLMDAILSGGKSVSWNGGGYMGRSARLYRALVQTELATSVGSGVRASLDPNLFSVWLTARDGVAPETAEAALLRELERVAEAPPMAEELARALRQSEAQFAYGRDGVTSQAFALGYFEHLGDWQGLAQHVERLRAVTAEEVQRVAATYLTADNRVVGWFVPTESASSRVHHGGTENTERARKARQQAESGTAKSAV
jgi:zinc protease